MLTLANRKGYALYIDYSVFKKSKAEKKKLKQAKKKAKFRNMNISKKEVI